MFNEDNKLCFGAEDGRLCEFHTDYDNSNSFIENDEPIYCCWTTAEFYGSDFSKYKKFRQVAALLGSAVYTGCRIWGEFDEAENNRELLVDYNKDANFLDFNQIDFDQFTFSTNTTPQTIKEKIKTGKTYKITLIFENNRPYQPFSLYSAMAEFEERR